MEPFFYFLRFVQGHYRRAKYPGILLILIAFISFKNVSTSLLGFCGLKSFICYHLTHSRAHAHCIKAIAFLKNLVKFQFCYWVTARYRQLMACFFLIFQGILMTCFSCARKLTCSNVCLLLIDAIINNAAESRREHMLTVFEGEEKRCLEISVLKSGSTRIIQYCLTAHCFLIKN